MDKIMPEVVKNSQKRQKFGGRRRGTPNRVTSDVRQALRDLANANAPRVQEWLDSVADTDPAEALRLWLALLRYVTPTLQAAAIADLTPAKSTRARLASMTDAELMEVIVKAPEAAELVKQGVKTQEELLLGIAYGPAALARQGVKTKGESVRRLAAPATVTVNAPSPESSGDELLR
jgi:hypothetical protein